MAGGHHHELDVNVPKEVFRCAMVPDVWEVDRAMRSWCCVCSICGGFRALEDGDDFVVWDGGDEGDMKVFGCAAVAYDTDLYRSHGGAECVRQFGDHDGFGPDWSKMVMRDEEMLKGFECRVLNSWTTPMSHFITPPRTITPIRQTYGYISVNDSGGKPPMQAPPTPASCPRLPRPRWILRNIAVETWHVIGPSYVKQLDDSSQQRVRSSWSYLRGTNLFTRCWCRSAAGTPPFA